MFETLKRLWAEGKLTEEKLNMAITRVWITEEQKQEIMEQV